MNRWASRYGYESTPKAILDKATQPIYQRTSRRNGGIIMCALFGWLNCGNILPHKVLKKFTQELANAAEECGTDASGISYVSKGRISIYKKPKPAHKVKFNFPENTTAVMGDTRLTTQGNQKLNFETLKSMADIKELYEFEDMYEYCENLQ